MRSGILLSRSSGTDGVRAFQALASDREVHELGLRPTINLRVRGVTVQALRESILHAEVSAA
jgi:hypothetical protein